MYSKTSWQKYTGKIAWPTIILFIVLLLGYFIVWYAYKNGLPGFLTSGIAAIFAYGMFTISHEACHGNISGGVRTLKLIEQMMGWFSAALLMFPFSAFTVIHLRHHAHTNDPVKDPDNYVNGSNWFSIFIRCTTLIGHYFWLSLGKESQHDMAMKKIRNQSLIFLGLLFVVIGVFITIGEILTFVYVFVLSALLVAPVLAFTFDWIPHYPHQNLNKYHNTRVVTIPGLEFISLYQSYHLMHHLYPRVPFYNYKDCFKDYEKELRQEQSPIEGFRQHDLGLFKKENTYQDINIGKQWSYILEVEYVVNETHDALKIVFKNLNGISFNYLSGQFVVVTDYIDYKPVSRCYSLCEDPSEGRLAIVIKRVAGGKLSNHLLDTIKSGSKLKVSGPFGDFVLPETIERPLLFIAGGSGITPVISMIKTALRLSNQKITLLYGCKSEKDVILSKDLDQLLSLYPSRFEYIKSFKKLDVQTQYKYVLSASIHSLCFICGPAPMMKASMGALDLLGIPKHQINVEEFSVTTEAFSGKTYPIKATVNGVDNSFEADSSETILSASIRNYKELPFACGMGQCGTCKALLLSGEVAWQNGNHTALLPNEIKHGYILPCICKPKTAIEIRL